MGDVLFLAHRVPYPPTRGDKIRGFNILRHLGAGRRVHLLSFADDARDLHHDAVLGVHAASSTTLWRGKPRWRAAVEALLTRRPVSLTAFAADAMQTAVDSVLSSRDVDTIYVFSSQMAQYLPNDPHTRIVMDFVDMDSAKFAGYAKEAHGPSAWLMRREARLLLAHDRAVAERAAASLFVSADEAALFRDAADAPRVMVVENGIDTAFFDPAGDFARVDETGPLIVFTGQMDYRPNIEAVAWFADAILPTIRVRHPAARFAIVGRAPTVAVRALADRPGVIVTGEVDDVRGWLAAASVVVAPLRLARGIQNKVLEAMAMARPVVASASAAEGIDHAGTLRIGADATTIATTIGALLDDPAAAAALGVQARAQVQRRYAWNACLAPLDALLDGERAERAAA